MDHVVDSVFIANFVIRWICKSLVVADRYSMSVGLAEFPFESDVVDSCCFVPVTEVLGKVYRQVVNRREIDNPGNKKIENNMNYNLMSLQTSYLVGYSSRPVESLCISNSWSAFTPTSSNVIFGLFLNLKIT